MLSGAGRSSNYPFHTRRLVRRQNRTVEPRSDGQADAKYVPEDVLVETTANVTLLIVESVRSGDCVHPACRPRSHQGGAIHTRVARIDRVDVRGAEMRTDHP